MRDSVVRLCFEVARFQHTTLGPLGCGLMVCHALMDCHPERSRRFAKRSSYVVEGPLHIRHSQRSVKAFSPRNVWSGHSCPLPLTLIFSIQRVSAGAPSFRALCGRACPEWPWAVGPPKE